MMADWEIEKYAANRIDRLTRAIAAALTPETLDRLVDDLTENEVRPLPADYAAFRLAMVRQRGVLAE